MGLSGSKTTNTNAPSAYSKPYIDAGAGALGSAFNQTQPLANSISGTIGSHLSGLAGTAFSPSAGITAATGYNSDVLGGHYLDGGNPYLSGMVNTTSNDVQSRINSTFGAAGRTGSDANQYALTKGLADSENGLRYGAYNDERSRMGQAAGMAPGLDASRFSGLGAYLTAAQGAVDIPQHAASAYAGGLGSLVGGYNTGTQTTSQGLGSILGQVAGAGLAGWASGGFKRI